MRPQLGPLAERTFAAVLFDLDGTLVDSTAAVVRSWVRWAQEEGLDPRSLDGFHGIPAAGIIAALLPEERRESAEARITALELAGLDGITLLPGAAEALSALAPQHCAIATSCTRDLARARIAATRLAEPEVVVTVDDVARGKPHPDPYLEAAHRLGADPRECLVVEDAPGGLRSARAAGCATLAVTTTTRAADLSADAVVADLSAVRFARGTAGVTLTAR